MESPEGAPQSVQQREATITAPTPVEPSKAEKGPGPLKKIWMTIRGQNHQSPGEIHADLADKKIAGSESSSGAETSTPPSNSSIITPTPAEQIGLPVRSPELAPIEAAPAADSGVDAMITQLQEKENDDAGSPASTPEPAPTVIEEGTGGSSVDTSPPPPAAQAHTEDTGAALDAMAARLITVPDGASNTATQPEQSPPPSISNTADGRIVDTSATTSPADASRPAIQQPAPTPITEAPIGLKSAEDAAGDSDAAPTPPPAPESSNVINFQSAAARIQEGANTAPAQQPEAPAAAAGPAGPAQLKPAA